MTAGGRPGQPGQPDGVDTLALAEAVAAGRLGFAAAEAALWEAHPEDQGRAANEVAELRDLVAAIRGVRRHAEAVRRADVEVFDPDATSVPLGSARPVDDDRGIAPRRVRGGDVRLRPTARQRQRWAPVGALAAVAVLVVAVAIVVPGLLAPSVASSPLPTAGPSRVAVATPSASLAASPSGSPTANATALPTSAPPSPSATGVTGVPPIASQAVAGAPGIAYWTLTSEKQVTITEWRPDKGAPRFRFSVSTMPDPNRANAEFTDRRFVVSPTGTRLAFAETGAATARTRIFGSDGSLLWTDPQPMLDPDLAWSPDGSRLVIGSQPATWKIVTFPAGGGAPTAVTRTIPGAAYRVLGFSVSGTVLYIWDTNGEAEFWENPLQVVLPNGKPSSIIRFSDAGDPPAVSNGTTPASDIGIVDGWSSGSGTQPGVAPDTGLVLDRGGAVGIGAWELRDGPKASPLELGPGDAPALAWGPDGSIVVARVVSTDTPLSVTRVARIDPATSIGPDFTVPAGAYWRSFFGARGSVALLGLGTERAKDFIYLGADELVAVDLLTGRCAVLVPTDPGLTGIHTAGWITAP